MTEVQGGKPQSMAWAMGRQVVMSFLYLLPWALVRRGRVKKTTSVWLESTSYKSLGERFKLVTGMQRRLASMGSFNEANYL